MVQHRVEVESLYHESKSNVFNRYRSANIAWRSMKHMIQATGLSQTVGTVRRKFLAAGDRFATGEGAR